MTQQQEKLLQLLEDHGNSLRGLLTKLTLRQDIAEELMQDLFIKLNNLKTLEKIANLTSYLYISIPYFFAPFESSEFELSDVVDNVK